MLWRISGKFGEMLEDTKIYIFFFPEFFPEQHFFFPFFPSSALPPSLEQVEEKIEFS